MQYSQALKQFLPGEIHGAINVVCTIEKVKYIKREAAEVEQDVPNIWSKRLRIQRKLLKEIRSDNSVKQFQEKLSSARYELFQAKNKTERSKAATTSPN